MSDSGTSMRWVLGILAGIGLLVYLAFFNAKGAKDAATPPIFSAVLFEQALAGNTSDDKLLFVKATAAWCPPCKEMNRTTLRDPKVVAYLQEQGVAVEVDVDEHPATARTLNIQAMPTMIAFREGKEVSRHVGFMDAGELLAWLKAAR